MEEAVAAFQAARLSTFQLAKESKENEDGGPRRRKRSKIEREPPSQEDTSTRTTRSQSKRGLQASQSEPEAIEFEDTDDEGVVSPEKQTEPEPEDGLVPCPMCGKRMKEEAVFPHLDKCEDEQKQTTKQRTR